MKKVTKKVKSNCFVAYVSDEEALITTEANEKKMLKVWMFGDADVGDFERYISDYDRYIFHSDEVAVAVSLRSRMVIDNGRIEYK